MRHLFLFAYGGADGFTDGANVRNYADNFIQIDDSDGIPCKKR